jgi:probable selenium-dependent hydroxylase accessory protein YqeC
MFALAVELAGLGKRVVTGTTTKIAKDEAQKAPQIVCTGCNPNWQAQVKKGLLGGGHVLVGCRSLASGKLKGIPPADADLLYQDPGADYLILEADGAARRPIKAPAAHEPVTPLSATVVVAIIGADAISEPCTPETVYRLEEFARLTGLRRGDRLDPERLAGLFLEPEGLFKNSPKSARRIVFLNRIDRMQDPGPAESLADSILASDHCRVLRVIIGSVMQGICSARGRDI